MTTIYFVRHAEPNYGNSNDRDRELTEKGLEDRKLVSEYLEDKNVDVVLSSPYKRAIDTVEDFASTHNYTIETVEDFRERKIDSIWIEDYDAFSEKQWKDFSYKLSDGETLFEVQERNIRALNHVIEKYENKTVVVGSHGTALSTIIHYFDNTFGYDDFVKIKSLMPWIVRFDFCNGKLQRLEKINLFAMEI